MPTRESAGLPEEDLTHSIIGAFLKVHTTLGFGFLEGVYAAAMQVELNGRKHHVEREICAVVRYGGVAIARQRLDMVVDGKVIKATETLHRGALRQLHNYLRATDLGVGLFLHFGRAAHFYRVSSDRPVRRVN